MIVSWLEGTPPLRGVPYPTLNHTGLEGTRPLSGPALPNLINAVRMFKINLFISALAKTALNGAGDREGRPYGDGVDVEVDFNILTAFIRLGRAGREAAGCPP